MPHPDILLRSKLRIGKELIAARRFEEARLVYQQICAKLRNDAENWLTLGAINGMLKRHDEAIACCSKAVELAPQHSVAWYNLGIALRDTGQPEKAVTALRKTLALNPRHESAATSLGHILASLHRYEEAEDVFREVLRYQPGNAEFYAVYGSAMQSMGCYEVALNAYRKAIEMNFSKTAEVYENMAVAFCLQGKYEESFKYYAAALAVEPENTRIYSSMLLTLHYLPEHDSEKMLNQHKQWPGNTSRPSLISAASNPIAIQKRTKLRIGYVSSDLRKHSVAFFIEPLLACHDSSRYEVTCYFSHLDADATTARLRSLAHRWRDVAAMDDDVFFKQIVEDGIDILVDLNGHTAGNRLSVFARRAAPVQISFIGYPDTTGLVQMDYRLSDLVADPAGSERECTESLVRLPGCFLCYRPPDKTPSVTNPPRETNGFVTFGSFNNLAKVTPAVIALWADLLKDVPNSRLILKNPSLRDKATRERYQDLFATVGISNERFELLGYIPDDTAHLGLYAKVDIALDTFPYNGTTTTCEALWMGVPVVSLCGNRHSARVGASLLTAAGFPEWVANTPERYIQIARELMAHPESLIVLRSRLRERLLQSSLCSASAYTKTVESVYEKMYNERVTAME